MSTLKRIAVWSKQLVARVYLFSVALIIIAAFVFFVVGMNSAKKNFRNVPIFVLSTVCQHWDDPAVMKAQARHIKELVGNEITLYDAQNRLLFSTANPPLASLSSEQIEILKREGKLYLHSVGPLFAMSIQRQGAFVGYGLHTPPSPPLMPFTISAILIFIVIAVFSYIFARSLAQPISRLSSVAHAFGNGDFTIRTNIRRNDELGYLAKTFDEMADRVNDLLRSEKELLANVSHELRTPLSRIRVALDIAAESAPEEGQKQWADMAEDLEELDQLIGNILMATRLDLDHLQLHQSALPMHYEQIDAGPYLRAIADRSRTIYPDRLLELSVEEPLPVITADPQLLRRVVENILDNARKYSCPGSAIAIRAHHGGRRLLVEITDQGIGIAEADLKNVFKPFFRADRSRTRATGGVGLGLTLSQRIIEAHGGSISISSRLHSGTTICFSIPFTSQFGNSQSS